MKKWRWIELVIYIQIVVCHGSHVTQNHHYEARSLKADKVSVHVQSDIKGAIKWTYTDLPVFAVNIKLPPSRLNTTDVTFLSDSNSVKLLIQERPLYNLVEPVTGSGNGLLPLALLVWLPVAILFGGKRLIVVIGMVSSLWAFGFASRISRDEIEVEIFAPRRFHYSNVSLYIEGGTVTMNKADSGNISSLDCRTNKTEIDSCPGCCYGNGVCKQGTCVCNDRYDELTFCETRSRLDLFYSHPLDPRLETVLLPSGTLLTLSRSYNIAPPDMTSPSKHLTHTYSYVMESRDNIQNLKTRWKFENDGFISEVEFRDSVSSDGHKIVLERHRVNKCEVSAIWSASYAREETEFSVNICDTVVDIQSDEAPPSGTKSAGKGTSSKRHNRRSRHNSKRGHRSLKVDMIEVPVLIERCGYSELERAEVFVEMKPITSVPFDSSGRLSKLTLHEDFSEQLVASVMILSEKNSNGKSIIRIPDTTKPLDASAVKVKCKETTTKHNDICSPGHLRAYTKICVKLSEVLSDNDLQPSSTNGSLHQYFNFCRQIVRELNSYCDSGGKVISKDRTCRTQYSSSVNLFSADYFQIIPHAVYPDGKSVTGREYRLLLRDAAEILHNGIIITDNKPEFKIIKITVIPKDPVPQDIYRVKMEYNCATNSTVIKMVVTGSDKYSNHVTCHGAHPIGSCTLHAAGAQNAVVDNVTIEVSDSHTGFNMTEKMVVIF